MANQIWKALIENWRKILTRESNKVADICPVCGNDKEEIYGIISYITYFTTIFVIFVICYAIAMGTLNTICSCANDYALTNLWKQDVMDVSSNTTGNGN